MPVAVITGSSSGIGRATAIEFAKRGFDVVLHARKNLKGLQATALELVASTEQQTRVLCLTGDISDSSSCRNLVDASFAWQGHVDAWVNNAGADILTEELAKQNFEQKLRALWEVDVMGTICLSRMVSTAMQNSADVSSRPDRAPTIINIGWNQANSGMEGEPGQLFCTTKAAVEAFTRSLALSVAPRIIVHLVAPGWIKTKWGDTASEYWDTRAKSESLLDRWGTSHDVAQTIVWLASDEAQFLNSQVLCVDGGLK